MICGMCKAGGRANAMTRSEIGKMLRGQMADIARNYHYQCDERCDCQHKTGKWIAAEASK